MLAPIRPEQPSTPAPEGAPVFTWTACPTHPWFGQAGAIVVGRGDPWCPGTGEGPGHWVERAVAA